MASDKDIDRATDAMRAITAESGSVDTPLPATSSWRLAAFMRDRVALSAAIFLATVCLVVILAPLISPYSPNTAINQLRFAPPLTHGHVLGMDEQGRDMLSRLIWGGRVSLIVGILPVALATGIGLLLGLLAGYAGGLPDQIIMRTLDVLFAFPMVLLAIAIAGVLTPGYGTEIIAITIVLVPYVGRLARTATLSITAMPFIEAARAAGASRSALLLRYITPNVLPALLVYATTLVGLMIVVGSGLSFLGLGVQPPTADWGTMVSEGRSVLSAAPHVTFLPGLVIVVVSLAFNFLGDGLRDALDPRSARR
ncbi:MAG TPA: ABC transporter permease [Acidisoma sp.]|uniref:ABC transporter permease n=1 Tax=Acidisoma sp. TaxID=1872115 RepID=UPI002BDB99CA|nr:ABC transporter permease [Acidisoma sp.]HTI03289.1 ABC transporter permease [Acidisoma sp.]